MSMFSCLNEPKEVLSNQITLSIVDEISFPLDSTTGSDFTSINTFIDNGIEYVSALNIGCGCINVYNYNTQKVVQKIILNREGPNGVGQMNYEMFAHYMPNLDTFFILNSWSGNIFIFNKENKMLKKIKLSKDEFKPIAVPYASSANPIQKLGDNLYIPLYPYGESLSFSKIPSMIKINIVSEEKTKLFYFPEIYEQNFFGFTPFKYRSNVVLQQDGTVATVGFATDKNTYLYRNGKLVLKKEIISEKFDKIQPLTGNAAEIKKLFNSSSDDEKVLSRDLEYAMTNPDYNWLIYDEENNVYIRLCYLRPTKDQFLKGARRSNFSLVILDSNLETIGETFLSGGLFRSSSFFYNAHGLHIFSEDKTSRNENEVVFSIFKPTRIEHSK